MKEIVKDLEQAIFGDDDNDEPLIEELDKDIPEEELDKDILEEEELDRRSVKNVVNHLENI